MLDTKRVPARRSAGKACGIPMRDRVVDRNGGERRWMKSTWYDSVGRVINANE